MEIKTVRIESGSIYNLSSSIYELLPALSGTYYYETSKIITTLRNVTVPYNTTDRLDFYASDAGLVHFLYNDQLNSNVDSVYANPITNNFSGSLYLKILNDEPTQGDGILQIDLYYEQRDRNETAPKLTFAGPIIATGSFQQGDGLAIGTGSHAEGSGTTYGDGSHAEGQNTVTWNNAAYSHAEGVNSQTYGAYSHAEGNNTVASGAYSHAEGASTLTYADYSHAEGVQTITHELYLPVTGSPETIYAYDASEKRLLLDASSNDVDYILWDDETAQRIWLSAIDLQTNISYNGTAYTAIYISPIDNQIAPNTLSGSGNVYTLADAVTKYYQYGSYDSDAGTLEYYGDDISGFATNGVVLTVPNSGSYAFDISSATYSSFTTSIVLGPSQSFSNHINQGSPSLSGKYTGGHFLISNINTGGNLWTDNIASSLGTNDEFVTNEYYNYRSQSLSFSGSHIDKFKPTTEVYFNNSTLYVSRSTFDGTITTVYPTTQQSYAVYTDATAPNVIFGRASHAGGTYTRTRGTSQTVVGRYNVDNNYTDLFVVGGGDGINSRKDALAVSANGVRISGSVSISGSLLVNGTAPGGATVLVDTIGARIYTDDTFITAGSKGYKHIAYDADIVKTRTIANTSGSIDVNIRRNGTTLGTISLSNQSSSLDTTLTGWTTQLNTNDLIEFYVSQSSTYITDITIFIDIQSR